MADGNLQKLMIFTPKNFYSGGGGGGFEGALSPNFMSENKKI